MDQVKFEYIWLGLDPGQVNSFWFCSQLQIVIFSSFLNIYLEFILAYLMRTKMEQSWAPSWSCNNFYLMGTS